MPCATTWSCLVLAVAINYTQSSANTPSAHQMLVSFCGKFTMALQDYEQVLAISWTCLDKEVECKLHIFLEHTTQILDSRDKVECFDYTPQSVKYCSHIFPRKNIRNCSESIVLEMDTRRREHNSASKCTKAVMQRLCSTYKQIFFSVRMESNRGGINNINSQFNPHSTVKIVP